MWVSGSCRHHSMTLMLRQGKIDKNLKGTIGKGEGRITLRTNDDSIRIR